MLQESTPWNRTISLETARIVADRLHQIEFEDELDRVGYFTSFDDVSTVDDYLTVTTLADTVPDTNLTDEEVFEFDNRTDLLSSVIRARTEQVGLDQLFRTFDARDREIIEIEQRDFSNETTPSLELTEPEFTHDELNYTTTTIMREMHGFQSVLCGNAELRSFDECCQIIARGIFSQIYSELPEPTTVDTIEDALFDLTEQIRDNNYYPDTIVLPANKYGWLTESAPTEHPVLLGCNVVFSKVLDNHQFVVGDSDHVGYEVEFRERELNQYRDLELRKVSPFKPIRWEYRRHTTWEVIESDAVEQCYIEDLNSQFLRETMV